MSEKIYAWLLWLYPRRFREEYGAAALQLFRDRLQTETSLAARLRLWIDVAADFAISIPREYRRPQPSMVTAAVGRYGDVPAFHTLDTSPLRLSALTSGGLLSLALFAAVSLAMSARGGYLPLRGRLPASQDEARSSFRPFANVPSASSGGGAAFTTRWSPHAIPDVMSSDAIWPRLRSFFTPSVAAVLKHRDRARPNILDAFISQFDKSDIVALGELHWTREDSVLRLQLLHHPDFANKVHNVIIECGNSLYQPVLDRYIRGENVPKQEIQKVWRDITSPGACDSPVYEQLVTEVRSLNRGLSDAAKLRVLAADPPIDWTKVKGPEDWRRLAASRDQFAADLIAQEVLGNNQKALVIYGAAHLWRNNPSTLAALLERDFPNRLYTVVPIAGRPYAHAPKLEQMIPTPERPVLLPLKGTSFASLDANEFLGWIAPIPVFRDGLGIGEVADACIYRGQTPDTIIPPDPSVTADPAYTAEKARRLRLTPRPTR